MSARLLDRVVFLHYVACVHEQDLKPFGVAIAIVRLLSLVVRCMMMTLMLMTMMMLMMLMTIRSIIVIIVGFWYKRGRW